MEIYFQVFRLLLWGKKNDIWWELMCNVIGRSVVVSIEKRGKRLFGFFKKERLLLLNLPVYIVEGEITLYEQVFQRKRRIGNRILRRNEAACFLSSWNVLKYSTDIFTYYVRRRYYIDYVTHVESHKNLSIVDDGKIICIKIHDPIINIVGSYTYPVKRTALRFLLRSGAKIERKIREKKRERKKEKRKARTFDDNLISEIIAIVTDHAIYNLRYVMLASYIDAEKGSSAISSELRSAPLVPYFRLANDIYRATVITVVRVNCDNKHGLRGFLFPTIYREHVKSGHRVRRTCFRIARGKWIVTDN